MPPIGNNGKGSIAIDGAFFIFDGLYAFRFPNEPGRFWYNLDMKVQCHCGAIYRPSPKLAGKRVRCKKCSATLQIPASHHPPTARQQKEDKLLAGYANKSNPTLDERMAERQRQTLEDERIPNAVKHALLGLGCIGAAAVVYFGLNALENGGIAPRIVWLFVLLKGKFWIPPLLVLTGFYQFFLAYWFLIRKSNVDDQPPS